MADISNVIDRSIAGLIMPACFGKYQPRQDRWDLDSKGHTPILCSLETPFSAIRFYYMPPLEPSHTKQVVICYPGNTRPVGAMMDHFWSRFDSKIALILVNPCGQGMWDEDRSAGMDDAADGRMFEAWLQVIPFAMEQNVFQPVSLDWAQFEPRTVSSHAGRLGAESARRRC